MPTRHSVNGAMAHVHVIAPDRENRARLDFYKTPRFAIDDLLDREPFPATGLATVVGGPQRPGIVCDPCCGDGAIAEAIEARGHTVVATDLVDRGWGLPHVDFLDPRHDGAFADVDHVVMNPPFTHVVEFIERALEVVPTGGKVATIARTLFLEGKTRYEWWRRAPCVRVWVFSERVSISRNADARYDDVGGMVSFAWFCFQRGARPGAPTVGWIPPLTGRAG